MRFFTLIFLASLILAKVLLGTVFMYQLKADPLGLEGHAIASELPENAEVKTEDRGTPAMKQDIDMDSLLRKQTDLHHQEEELAKKKVELMTIQEEINRKIESLTRLRNEIRSQVNQKKTREDAKLRHLIKAYSAMKPQKAATLIEKLDINFAIEMLSKMKGDTVGSILTFVEVGKAAKISEGLAKR
jgi:flagellar motility protein MotE (MotC chaperone)